MMCHPWVSTPGSVFEALEPLRSIAKQVNNSPAEKEMAIQTLATLRAGIRPGDAMSLLRAGYWTTAMHRMKVTTVTDGPELIERAVSLRPDDAEYHVIAAIVNLNNDGVRYWQHWDRAKALAKPGSAAAQNLPREDLEKSARSY